MDNPNQNDNNVDQLDEVVNEVETNNKKSNSFLKVVLAYYKYDICYIFDKYYFYVSIF